MLAEGVSALLRDLDTTPSKCLLWIRWLASRCRRAHFRLFGFLGGEASGDCQVVSFRVR
jgi:hypothetical protein